MKAEQFGWRGKHFAKTSAFQIHDLENDSEEVNGGRVVVKKNEHRICLCLGASEGVDKQLSTNPQPQTITWNEYSFNV